MLNCAVLKQRARTMSKRFKKLKNSGPYEATISKLSHEARGISQIDGKTTFITGSLPGERVMFEYKMCRSSYDEGDACDILEPSSDRVTPQCPHFGTCGGCQLQHLSHSKQLEHKQNTLHELLAHHANTDIPTVLPTLSATPWGYRRKARISVKQVDGKGDVLIGFRERRSRYVTDMRQCEVLIPEVGHKLDELRQQFSQLHAKASIAQIEMCASNNEVALIIRHLEPLDSHDLDLLVSLSKQHGYKLYLQPKGYDSVHLVYPETADFLMHYELPEFKLHFKFHPSGFIQVNDEINQKMVSQAITLLQLSETDRVLDLFCGIGNFSLAAATQASHVTGVEGDEQAVNLATENATLNQISNTEFYTSNLFEINEDDTWVKQRYNKLLLDPPRSGCKEIMPFLKHWQPERIVYVSCNPITFARDIGLLKESGYQLTQAGVMDMFPHTQHMEVMGVLERANRQ